MIKVLLADDQTLVRQGISSLLELSKTIRVVAELPDGREVLSQLEKSAIDVVLLDLQMPNMDGIQVLEAMRNENSLVPVIVLTTFADDHKLLRCAQLGARGYLLKDVSYEQLVNTIEEVHAGNSLMHNAVTQRIPDDVYRLSASANDTSKSESLTSRESEILHFLAGGYSNKEIAAAINLSEGTIKNHVSNLLAKLGVRDRTRAVVKALEEGLLKR